jgi:quercetin dioxygenase-like cupin family protein
MYTVDKPEKRNLTDSIDYSDNSVISKQIIKSPAGNITLFSFDEGEGLSEHSAPFDAFVQVLDGQVEILIGGKPHTLTAGDYIIMPANIPHALKAIKRFKMMLVMIK